MTSPTQPPQHGGTPTPRTDANIIWGYDDAQQAFSYCSPDFARTLERELIAKQATTKQYYEAMAKYQNAIFSLESQLTTALDEKRGVEIQQLSIMRMYGRQFGEDLPTFLARLEAHLALAEGLAQALGKAKNGLEWYRGEHPEDNSPADFEMEEEIEVSLRRWAESRTEGTNLGGDVTMPDMGFRNGELTTPAIPSEPASRAVPRNDVSDIPEADFSPAIPITRDTVVPFPCWVWATYVEPSQWMHVKVPYNSGTDMLRVGYTHYHPDQPTPPTSRPTARGQQ